MSEGSRERIRSMTAAVADILAPFSAKRLARAGQAHTKTAERWRRGEAVPSGEAMLRMMARDDDLFAALLAAAGRSDEARRAQAAAVLQRALREMGG